MFHIKPKKCAFSKYFVARIIIYKYAVNTESVIFHDHGIVEGITESDM